LVPAQSLPNRELYNEQAETRISVMWEKRLISDQLKVSSAAGDSSFGCLDLMICSSEAMHIRIHLNSLKYSNKVFSRCFRAFVFSSASDEQITALAHSLSPTLRARKRERAVLYLLLAYHPY
jgi:hypothetical protein